MVFYNQFGGFYNQFGGFYNQFCGFYNQFGGFYNQFGGFYNQFCGGCKVTEAHLCCILSLHSCFFNDKLCQEPYFNFNDPRFREVSLHL